MTDRFLHGIVHDAGADLRARIQSDLNILRLWEILTPFGRNEFICWVDDAKQPATRQRRIERTCDELLEGKKRPCCWAGCIHRADKAPSRWQQEVLVKKKRRKRSLDRLASGYPHWPIPENCARRFPPIQRMGASAPAAAPRQSSRSFRSRLPTFTEAAGETPTDLRRPLGQPWAYK